MKRIVLSLTIAAALLFPTATNRPVYGDEAPGCLAAILASFSFNILALGVVIPSRLCYTPFTGTQPFCDITQVGASASKSGSGHSYDYDLSSPCPAVHVHGGYDTDTKDALERLEGYGDTAIVTWTCSDDPWIYQPGQRPSCTRTKASLSVNTTGLSVDQIVGTSFPISAGPLSDLSRQTLNGQLNNAISQLPTPVQQTSGFVNLPTASLGQAASEPSTAAQSLPLPAGPVRTGAGQVQYHAYAIVGGWPLLSSLTQGEAVTSLQYLLQQSGATLDVDGKFGPQTDAAVRAFQQAQGLAANGVVEATTWQALIVDLQQDNQGPAVRAVQSQLKARGVAISVDGIFGAQTDAAVKAFQQNHGLVVDGQVGQQTWPVLLSGN
jgi:peptidoglycan hydrolase-like protein with peptidoglycan-binding domain